MRQRQTSNCNRSFRLWPRGPRICSLNIMCYSYLSHKTAMKDCVSGLDKTIGYVFHFLYLFDRFAGFKKIRSVSCCVQQVRARFYSGTPVCFGWKPRFCIWLKFGYSDKDKMDRSINTFHWRFWFAVSRNDLNIFIQASIKDSRPSPKHS